MEGEGRGLPTDPVCPRSAPKSTPTSQVSATSSTRLANMM